MALLVGVTAAPGAPAPPLELAAQPDRVELATARQKLVFARAADGTFALTTHVRDRQGWRALFDAGRPLLEGPSFGLQPTHYVTLTNTPTHKEVEFSGRHRQPDYDWNLRVSAAADSPLFRFTITCRLPEPLPLKVPQPVVGLWMKRASPAFHLDQGPDSIYGSAGIPHNYGFPAAYLWEDGCAAAVLFNLTPMRWMQPGGVARFHDVRIMTRGENGQTGLGMHFKKASGLQLPTGEMTVEFFLYQDICPQKPTGLEALDTMVRVFAPLHPSESVIPLNHLTGRPARWEQFARQAMVDVAKPATMAEIAAPWSDQPLELVASQERMLVHPSARAWDFSTVNNHLTPWLLLARLDGIPTPCVWRWRRRTPCHGFTTIGPNSSATAHANPRTWATWR